MTAPAPQVTGAPGRLAARQRPVARIRSRLALLLTERALVLRALVIVVAVRVALSCLPSGRVIRATMRLQTMRIQRSGVDAAARAGWSPERVARAVRIASRRVPRATCLTQAVSTQLLLASAGRPSRIRLGVGRDDRGAFCAHAWLEVDGVVVIGGEELERYVRLPDLAAGR